MFWTVMGGMVRKEGHFVKPVLRLFSPGYVTTKRQDPCRPTDLPYDFRIDRAEVQRSEADTSQAQNADRSLTVTRGSVTYQTAVFSKTLPQNQYGEVSTDDFTRLEVALRSGEQKWFDLIQRAPGAVRKLVDPQASLAFSLSGADSHTVTIPPAPSLVSAEAASEMLEVYGKALLRDVVFRDLQNGTTGDEAVVQTVLDDLNAFGPLFTGPKDPVSGMVTRQTLFRGNGVGETVGPYVSQFLLHDFSYGNAQFQQTYNVESDAPDSITVPGWLDIQRGITPPGANLTGNYRRINSPRVLGSYVHNDPVTMSYCNAALILLNNGAPKDPNIVNLPNEDYFVTLGLADVMARAAMIGDEGLKAAWHQKWNVNVKLRPEVMAGRVHFTLAEGQDYNLDPGLTGSGTVGLVLDRNTTNGSPTYLLPLQFPEGSPAHPSYPAGHATFAGAGVTLLKAFFDTDALMTDLAGGTFNIVESITGLESMADLNANAITDPSITSQLTVGVELNKLASNIAIGRNMAGVHYRSDGDQGILLGEKVAIQYLKDLAATYNQDFAGFNLTKFDGTQILIS